MEKDIIEEALRDKALTVNGREYKFLTPTFKTARDVSSFMLGNMEKGNLKLDFMLDKRWDEISSKIEKLIIFEDMEISKIKGHFDNNMEDYFPLMVTMVMVISSPFLKGSRIN